MLKHTKIVIVGSPQTGKTQLANRLERAFNTTPPKSKSNMFGMTNDFDATIKKDGITVNVEVCEGEREIFMRTVEYTAPPALRFLGAHIVVLVYAVNQPGSFDDLYIEYTRVRSLAGGDPLVVIVGNKYDIPTDADSKSKSKSKKDKSKTDASSSSSSSSTTGETSQDEPAREPKFSTTVPTEMAKAFADSLGAEFILASGRTNYQMSELKDLLTRVIFERQVWSEQPKTVTGNTWLPAQPYPQPYGEGEPIPIEFLTQQQQQKSWFPFQLPAFLRPKSSGK